VWTPMQRPSDATIASALAIADAPVEVSASQRLTSLRMALPFGQKRVEKEYAELRQQVIRLDADVHRLQRLHNSWAPDPNAAKPEPGMGSADQSMRMLRASATNEELIRKWTQVAELKEKMADMERRYPYLANADT